MATPYLLQELLFNTEASFAVNAMSPTSNTYATRIPCIGPPTVTLDQDRIRDGGIQSRSNEEAIGHIGVRSATLEFTTYWGGHQSTAAGALTETPLNQLFWYGLGGHNVGSVGTTVSGAASTTTQVNGTDLTTFVNGGLLRVGVKGDGRGDGAASPINAVTDATPDNATLLVALPAAPTTAGDVIYAMQLAYPDESTLTSLQSLRFMVGHTTSGAQFHLMGCQLQSMAFDLTPGDLPKVTLSYRAAYWDRGTATIPTGTSLSDNVCAPIAGGSFTIQDYGTTTRTQTSAANIRFTVDMGLEPITTVNATGTYGNITGWVRTKSQAMLSMDVPWSQTSQAGADEWDGTSNLTKHVLFQSNHTNGRSVGFYLPRCRIAGKRPSQVVNANNQNYMTINLMAVDDTTSTELQKSNFRLFAG